MAERIDYSRMDPGPPEQEWRTFELYEKIRVRERRHRLLVITMTTILFFALCSVPVIENRMPKWKGLRAARELAVEIQRLKTEAIREKKPVRLTFLTENHYRVEVVEQCKADARVIRSEDRLWSSEAGTFEIVSDARAHELKIQLSTTEVCFDPVFGLDGVKTKKVIIVAPVKDLAEGKLDRASYIVLESESAKISIN